MRARLPDADGYTLSGGVKIHYEVYGDVADGRRTILLLPTWTIIHKRFWKLQIPYLASQVPRRHLRRAGQRQVGPLRRCGCLRARPPGAVRRRCARQHRAPTGPCVIGLSMGATWGIQLAAKHPDRVFGLVTIGASVAARRWACCTRSGGCRRRDSRAVVASAAAWCRPTGALGERQARLLGSASGRLPVVLLRHVLSGAAVDQDDRRLRRMGS